MDTSRVLSILLIFVLIRLSYASTRSLIDKVSPSPAPNYSLSNKELSKNSHAKSVGPPPDSYDNGPSKGKEIEEKGSVKPASEGPNGNKYQLENCDRSLQKCRVEDLVACLWHSETANSKEWVVVVQNVGDYTLNVNITVPASVTIDAKMLNIGKHGTRKANISTGATKALKIVLDAGKGDCILPIGTGLSISDWMQHFPPYMKQFTPIYGSYFLLFTLIIAGAVWGCCKFRKDGRRVQYQQLEMGAQMQSNTGIVEASPANRWEESWDDEWDEEEARTRPLATTSPNGNASSNGLSSRSAGKKNDWDIDWDD